MSAIPSVSLNLGRRSFLRGALLNIAGVVLGAQMSGCSEPSPRHLEARPTSTGSKVLLDYFSRAGENYSYGGRTNLKVGNTEILAGMIGQSIRCDVCGTSPRTPRSCRENRA